MESVIGIGGLFFRANDPAALARWYQANLGIDLSPGDYTQKPWSQQAGPCVFAPFPRDTTYFGRPEQQWMINFRVDDLDAMAEQLRRAGESVDIDPQRYPNGRFAEVSDPEGNRIQLWQPMAPA